MSKFTCLTAAIVIACASAGVARAEDNAPKTRAEVVAEIHAARLSGELYAMGAEDSGSFWLSQQPWRSTLTRAEVIAEMQRDRARSERLAFNVETGDTPVLARPRVAAVLYTGPDVARGREAADAQLASAR